jgi:hypothetical protein
MSIRKVIVTQNKVTVVTVGIAGPPGETVYYNFIDYTLNSDGTGTKNEDYGIGATITPERVSAGKYTLTSNIPLYINTRVFVELINNEIADPIKITKWLTSDIIYNIECVNERTGELIDCDLSIEIKKLKT